MAERHDQAQSDSGALLEMEKQGQVGVGLNAGPKGESTESCLCTATAI